jgi:hypothetical protein
MIRISEIVTGLLLLATVMSGFVFAPTIGVSRLIGALLGFGVFVVMMAMYLGLLEIIDWFNRRR